MPGFYNQFPAYVGNFIVTNYLPDPGSDCNYRAQLPTAAGHCCPKLHGTVDHSYRALLPTAAGHYCPQLQDTIAHSCRALLTTAAGHC